uniref:Peptidase A1 domain-containing protein n=1 Tax=Bionectria ochroleuca TaxID=29856 RepID=A0A8H7NEJ1_BIOOC
MGCVTPSADVDSRSAPDVQPLQQSAKTISLSQVENTNFQREDPSVELIRTFVKYGKPLTPGLSEAIELNPDLNAKFKSYIGGDGETGTIKASPPALFDIQYVVPVLIGTPPQKTYLNLDTGSADFWTFSTDTYKPLVRNQTLYKPNSSSTSKLLKGEAWNIRYGDGAGASGIVYQDRVQVGGTFFNKQGVQSAVQVSFEISRDSFASGIMGMAMKGINTVRPTQQHSYFENILDSLKEPVFTANLQKGRPGNYNFGYIDDKEHIGNITYAPLLTDTPFWEVNATGYQVGDSPYQPVVWNALVDTGTSLLILPENIVNEYYTGVEGAAFDPRRGMMLFPCEVQLPDFYFGIGDYRGKIPGHYINYGKADPSYCYGGIQATDIQGPSVLGDILLKAQFVVFDGGKNAVGFANKQLLPPSKVLNGIGE